MTLARRSVATPRPQRSRLQRFLVALTFGDSGRNLAEVEGCWHLHQIAALEREVYGEVVSDSAREHVVGDGKSRFGACTLHWLRVEY
jgi:hypothetical protein